MIQYLGLSQYHFEQYFFCTSLRYFSNCLYIKLFYGHVILSSEIMVPVFQSMDILTS